MIDEEAIAAHAAEMERQEWWPLVASELGIGSGFAAGRCEVCGAESPTWSILRRGDAAVTWSCMDHLRGAK